VTSIYQIAGNRNWKRRLPHATGDLRLGANPDWPNAAVIELADVSKSGRVLRLLCESLGLNFTEAMLAWPAGPRDTHARVGESTGNDAVLKSTTFTAVQTERRHSAEHLEVSAARSRRDLRQLYEYRLTEVPASAI
jgi:hypothetical protein